MNLTEFLLARIAEDEEVAHSATSGQPEGPWLESSTDEGEPSVSVYGYPADRIIVRADEFDDVAHIARHDPARVLAECEAKRRIVAKAQRADVAFDHQISPATSAATFALTEVLHFLALPYADHPDYDEAWRA